MKIAVIGAGIVGISSANWLQKYGQDVTLFDMNDPGEAHLLFFMIKVIRNSISNSKGAWYCSFNWLV